jgi:hypothetical protein
VVVGLQVVLDLLQVELGCQVVVGFQVLVVDLQVVMDRLVVVVGLQIAVKVDLQVVVEN